jgi:hypothetical protein
MFWKEAVPTVVWNGGWNYQRPGYCSNRLLNWVLQCPNRRFKRWRWYSFDILCYGHFFWNITKENILKNSHLINHTGPCAVQTSWLNSDFSWAKLARWWVQQQVNMYTIQLRSKLNTGLPKFKLNFWMKSHEQKTSGKHKKTLEEKLGNKIIEKERRAALTAPPGDGRPHRCRL